jgi:hypothetical protein
LSGGFPFAVSESKAHRRQQRNSVFLDHSDYLSPSRQSQAILTFRQHYNAEQLNEEQIGTKRQPLVIDEIFARTLFNRVREECICQQNLAPTFTGTLGPSFVDKCKREFFRVGE